jgi:hypothetical protein
MRGGFWRVWFGRSEYATGCPPSGTFDTLEDAMQFASELWNDHNP